MSSGDWAILALGAMFVGFAKTAFTGFGTLATVAFVLVLPARASTGAVLPLLILGDLIAVSLYRRHADWHLLVRLLPSLVVGVLLGVLFLQRVDDVGLKRGLGALLVVLALLEAVNLVRERRSAPAADTDAASDPASGLGRSHVVAAVAGAATGFCTMVANAAGPVASLYLLLKQIPKMAFVGTVAWLFLLLNLVKIPFSVGLGLLTLTSLRLDLRLVPALLVGAAVGAVVLRRVDQRPFERVTLLLTAVSAVALLVT